MPEFVSLPDAISATVSDGQTVALEGFTHLIPFAAGHEIIRQGRKDLTLIRMTPDLIYDHRVGSPIRHRLGGDRAADQSGVGHIAGSAAADG